MQTIIIKIDSRELKNADLDIRYVLPDVLAEYTGNKVTDNGYDYIDSSGCELGIWLSTDDAIKNYPFVIEYIKNHLVCENDLSLSAEIFISEKESVDLEECQKVYPI
ncbi:MAG: hypothetical protein K2M46_09750 [Lachnospiraceae bacterium]|nr:hypothetical protein [Lachnospiraceae bacterium]